MNLDPLIVFEAANKREFKELFRFFLPEYEPKPAPPKHSICPTNNPDHISYQEKLEDILHHPREEARNAVIYVILGAHSRMEPPEKKKVADVAHGGFGNDRSPRKGQGD